MSNLEEEVRDLASRLRREGDELAEARNQLRLALEANRVLKQRLVKEMILTRTRTEMLEEFGPDYKQYL